MKPESERRRKGRLDPGASMEPPHDRVAAIDGLRAVAILLVFAAHSVGDLLPGGYAGVDMFMVISGYLTTRLLIRTRLHSGHMHVPRFLLRRALRLYPPLIAALAIVAGMVPLLGQRWPAFAADALSGLTYTFNFREAGGDLKDSMVGHLWSVCVQEQYYLVWPLILSGILASARLWTTWLPTLAALTVLAKAALLPWLGGGPLYFLPVGHADELLLGSILALLLQGSGTAKLLTWVRSQWVAYSALAPLLVVSIAGRHIQSAWLYLGGLTGLALCSCVVLAHLALTDRPSHLRRVLGHPSMAWLGQRSYGFYLVSQPVILLLRHLDLAMRFVLPIGFLLSLLFADASLRLMERPVVRWSKGRMRRRVNPVLPGKSQLPGALPPGIPSQLKPQVQRLPLAEVSATTPAS